MLQQKRSELLRLLFIISMLALTVGVVLVLSANNPTSTVMTTPSLVNGSANQTLNFTITNPAGSTEIDAVRVQKAAGFTTIDCGVKLPPGWSCDDTSSALQVDFVSGGTGIAAGASVPFMINGKAPATTGNQTFVLLAYETTLGDVTVNSTSNPINATVTVDADAPRILSLNLYNSSGAIVANETTLAEGDIYLRLTDFIFNITVFDTGGGSPSAVAVYYNNTLGVIGSGIDVPNQNDPGTYTGVLTMSNASGRKIPYTNVYFNATLLNSSLSANDSLTLTIVANDTLQNNNVTTGTFKMPNNDSASYFFNITMDGNAPLIYNITMGGANTAVRAYNLTNSTAEITLSVNVNDTNFGGSGVGTVVVYTSDSATVTTLTRSETSQIYNYTGSLSTLGATFGDHKVRLTILAIDAVGNENSTYFDVEIDDDAPTFSSIAANVTNNYVSTNNSQVNISFTVSGNLNITHNVSIHGPNDQVFYLTLNTGTISKNSINGSSTWFTTHLNDTGGIFATEALYNNTMSFSNLTQYGCPGGQTTDPFVCQLRINATDIFGRVNSTNLTITLDTVAPAVGNVTMNNTAASAYSNIAFKAGTKLKFDVNANNNIRNVTIGNGTIGFAHNMTALGANYSFILNVSNVCIQQGPCVVNFTATDHAGNFNYSTANSDEAFFILVRDDIAPNVTMLSISGRNFTGPGSLSNRTLGIMDPVRIARSDRVINLTVNSVDYNSTTTVVNVTVQNSTAAIMALWNTTSDWYNVTTLASLGCSANVEAQCILTFNATDNASNVNNSVVSPNQLNLTFRVDDRAPRVLNFSTNIINGNGRNVTSVTSIVINFSVNISEANIWNVTIQNTTVIKMNSSASTTSNTTTVSYWAALNLNSLGCTSDGTCKITINATDLAGNINASESIFVTSDSSALSISNRTFGATFVSSKPTIHVNTSMNAQCRYSTTGVSNYSQMATNFDVQNSRHNSFTLADTRDNDNYEYDVSCVDVSGGNVQSTTVKFTIDTTPLWNITIGATGALSAVKDYFTQANTWYTFRLPKSEVLEGTAVNARYNVTDVLASVMGASPGTAATNNLSVIWAHNRTSNGWSSFVYGRASGNTLVNFTSDEMDYYINLTVANERIEIN